MVNGGKMEKATTSSVVRKYRRTRSKVGKVPGVVDDREPVKVGYFHSLSRKTITDDLEKITSKRLGSSYVDIDDHDHDDLNWKKEEGVPFSEMVLIEDKDQKKTKSKKL